MLSRSELEERKRIFKNILIEITNYHQKVYLESKGIPFFDSFKMKTWHSQFSLDNIPDIPIFEMKEKPSVRIDTIGSFIKQNDFKNILVNEAMSNLQTNNCTNKFSVEGCQEVNENEENKDSCGILETYLSSNLIARVKHSFNFT